MAGNFIKSEASTSSNNQVEAPLCLVHSGESQYFFCVPCNISICYHCRLTNHSSPEHEIKKWKEVMEEEEKRKNRKRKLQDDERKLKSAKDKAEQDVKSRVQYVLGELKTWEKKMERDIEVSYQQHSSILQQKQSELDRSRRPQWNRSITSGKYELSLPQDCTLPHDMTSLYLEPGKFKLSNFGEIRTSGQPDEKQVSPESQKLKLTLLTEFNHSLSRSRRVASNQSNLIVVNGNTNDGESLISMFGKYNGEYAHQSQLEIGQRPIAISSDGKLITCDDGHAKEVSLSGRHDSSWAIKDNADVIALTPDDMVVIGRWSKKVITIHHLGGVLVRTHPIGLQCTLIASNGKQIAYTGRGLGSLTVIDFVTGDIKWAVNFSDPHDICYEQKSNTLLVLYREHAGNHIKQYCSITGRLVEHLTIDIGRIRFNDAVSMTTTKDNKMVVACPYNIKIYNILF